MIWGYPYFRKPPYGCFQKWGYLWIPLNHQFSSYVHRIFPYKPSSELGVPAFSELDGPPQMFVFQETVTDPWGLTKGLNSSHDKDDHGPYTMAIYHVLTLGTSCEEYSDEGHQLFPRSSMAMIMLNRLNHEACHHVLASGVRQRSTSKCATAMAFWRNDGWHVEVHRGLLLVLPKFKKVV